MRTALPFGCVALLMLLAESEGDGKLSSGGFLEQVARLASMSINENTPPHGLLYWSIKNPAPSSLSTSLSTTTPEGYEYHPGLGSYKLHDYAASWCIAKQICEEEGSHLLILNSEAESQMAKKLIAKFPTIKGTPQDSNWLWTGIHEKGTHGQFYTIFGEPLSATGFTRWDSPYPDKPGPADCGLVSRSAGGLADNPCGLQRGFICEHVGG